MFILACLVILVILFPFRIGMAHYPGLTLAWGALEIAAVLLIGLVL